MAQYKMITCKTCKFPVGHLRRRGPKPGFKAILFMADGGYGQGSATGKKEYVLKKAKKIGLCLCNNDFFSPAPCPGDFLSAAWFRKMNEGAIQI